MQWIKEQLDINVVSCLFTGMRTFFSPLIHAADIFASFPEGIIICTYQEQPSFPRKSRSSRNRPFPAAVFISLFESLPYKITGSKSKSHVYADHQCVSCSRQCADTGAGSLSSGKRITAVNTHHFYCKKTHESQSEN